MTVPLAVNSAIVPATFTDAPSGVAASGAVGPTSIVTVAVWPLASAIWEATVRFQMRSYSLNSVPRSTLCSSVGVRKTSPEGRIASCASCAFLDLLA